MIKKAAHVCLIALAWGALFIPGSVDAADQPAALVLSAKGNTFPRIEAYQELAAGSSLEVMMGAEVVLFHYRSCRRLVLVGGRVRLGLDLPETAGAQIDSDEEQRCPREVKLVQGGTAGGIVVRGGARLEVPHSLDCILVGKRVEDYRMARVYADARFLGEFPLFERRLRWPSHLPPLVPDNRYRLEFQPMGVGPPMTAEIVAAPEMGVGRLCLIRVE